MSITGHKAKPKLHSFPIHHIFGKLGNTKGEVGIELETIGKRLPNEFQETRLWKAEQDNSVKPRSGEMALEYVLLQPVGRIKVSQALQELKKEWDRSKAEIAEGRLSNSTHIHINAQQMTMQQVATWMALYYLFEEILVRWAGDDRIGNLFCLRGKDADGMIKMLSRAFSKESFDQFSLKTYRYSALNVCALAKYGSLEFRALRGTGDISVIQAWIETLLAIKDASLNYKNPVDVVTKFNIQSPFGTCVAVLPEPIRTFALGQKDLTEIMADGAQMVNEFAFSTKWDDNPQKVPEPSKDLNKKRMYTLDSVSGFPVSMSEFLGSETDTTTESHPIHWTTPSQPTPPHPATLSPHPSLLATYSLYKNTAQGSNSYKQPTTEIEFENTKYWRLSDAMRLSCIQNNRRLEMRASGNNMYLAMMTSDGSLVDWIRGNSMVQVVNTDGF